MNRSRKTGDLVSQNNLFVDITNDRIGIGSTVPGNKLSLPDSAKIGLGNAEDLTVVHDGNNSTISNSTGGLYLQSDTSINIDSKTGSHQYVHCTKGAEVSLWHNNSKKIETTSTGITVTGTAVATAFSGSGANLTALNIVTDTSPQLGGNLDVNTKNIVFGDSSGSTDDRLTFGAGTDLSIYHDGTNSTILNTTGELIVRDDSRVRIRTDQLVINSGDNTESIIYAEKDGAVELYHNNSKKFETNSGGINVDGKAIIDGVDVTVLTNGATNNGIFLNAGDTGAGNRPYIDLKGAGTSALSGKALRVYYDNGGTESFYVDYEGNISGKDITISDKIIHSGDTNTQIRFPAADTITAETGGSERLRITSDGKVGINRTSPTAPITARRLDAGGTGTSGVIAEFANSSGYGVWFGQSSASGASWGATTDDFYWCTGGLSSQTERLRITSSGNVGIGTEDPASILHLQSVNPTIRLTDSNQAADNKNWIISGGNTQLLRVQALNDAGSGGGSLFDFYRSGNNINELRGTKGGNTWFVVDNLNKQVGINTDNPEKRFTIWAEESDVDTDVFQIRGKTGAFNIRVNDADAANPEWAIRTYASEPIVFMQGTTERARISSAGLVGIGSDVPEVPLVVQGGTGNTPILARSTDTRSQIAFMDNATSGVGHVAVGCEGSSLFIRTGTGGKALTIDTAGRLLLGTTSNRITRLATNNFSPNLQIESDTVAAFSMTRWHTGTSPSRLVLQKGRGTIASPAVVADGDQVGQILFSGWDGDTFTNTAQIRSVVDGTPGDDQMPGNLIFATNSGGTATTERIRISSSGETKFTVGTNKTVKFYAASHNDETNLGAGLGFSRSSDGAEMLSGIFGHSNTGLGVAARDHITFLTGGTSNVSDTEERVRITSGGDVGVGNNSPNCRLAVKDVAEHTAYASVTPNVSDVMLQLYNNPPNETANDHATIQFGVNGGSHNRVNSISAVAESAGNRKMAFTFCTDEAGSRTEKMRITGDGKVGIGTVPVAGEGTELAIRSSDGQTNVGLIPNTNSESSQLTFYNASNDSAQGYIRYDNSDNSLQVRVNLAERLRIDSSGRLLLGTTTEGNTTADELTIATSAHTGMTIRSGTSHEGNIFFSDGTSGQDEYQGIIRFDHNDNALKFNTTGSERLRITSTEISAVNVVMRANNGFVSDTDLILNSDHNGNNSTNNNIIFQNRGNELARLKGTGFFGIGTDSPSSELHVFDDSGDVAATIETTGSGKDARLNLYAHNTGVSQIRLGDDTDTNIGRITYYHAASGTNEANSLEFITGDASRVRVASTGLVLPQTSNEIRTDSSDGSDNKRIIIAGGGDNSQSRGAQIAIYGNEYSSHEGRLQLLAGNSGNTNGVVQMYTAGTERILIQSDGQKIIKNGRLNINSTFIDFSGSISTPATAAAIFRPADNTLAFSTANTERLRIQSTGMNSSVNLGFDQTPHGDYFIDILNNDSAHGMRLRSTGSTYHDLVFDANRSSGEQAIGRIVGKWNGNNVAMIQVQTGEDTSNKDDGRIKFYTSESGSSVLERMQIRNNGTVTIGGANEVQLDATNEEILYLHGAIAGANVDFAYGMRIDLDDDDTGTTSADRERGSAMFQFNGNCTGGDTSNETRIWNIYSDVNCNEDYDNVYGLYTDCRTTHSVGTVSEMRGVYGLVQNADSGNVSNMTGLYGLVQSTTGANNETVNDMVGVRGRVNMCAGSSTANATDVVAVWGNIDNDNNTAQPSGGKCALFYGSYDKTTGLSNPHGVYVATDVPNYFAGPVKINSTNLTGGDSNSGQTPELYVNGYSNLGGLRVKGGDTGNTIYKEDGNLSIVTGTAHQIYLKTDGDDALTISSGGTVKLGTNGGATANSADIDANHTKLTIKQTANGREDGLYIERSGERKGYYMWMNASGGAGDALCFSRNSNGTKEDIMCLDRDGNTFIGGTERGQDTTSSNLSVYGNSSNTTANIPASFHCANVSSTRYLQSFCNGNGVVGSIRVNGTQTYFNTSSDYRLKENITPLTDAFTRLNALKPCRFNFKSDPSKTLDGFIAHEVEEVVPHAVAGEKDGMKPITFYEEGDTLPDGKEVGDGKTYSTTEIEPQQLDDSKLIPLLTAALQESVTEIENLKTKNSQLATLLDELKVRLDNAGL